MINLSIDTSSIADSFNLDQNDINQLLDFTVKEVTASFASHWEQEAILSLHSSRQQYINSLVVVDEGFAKGAVMLVGKFPNMIENGADSFDIKEGALNGPNAKTGKNGSKYNTIPFGFGTPGALEENFSGGVLPKEIHDIVSKKPANEPLQKYDLKNVSSSLRQPQKKTVKMPENKSFKEYQHKSSIYEGVSKRTDKSTGQNTYGSFRRISENSSPESWVHPGLEAHHIAEKALENFNVPVEIGRALDLFLSRI